MTGDRTPNTGPEPGKAPPGGARRDPRELLKDLDGPVDEHFKQSLAGLSSRLGDRAARQSTNDPGVAAEARRAALEAYDLERARRLKTALGAAGAGVATVGVAWLTVFIATPNDPTSPRAMASTERASRIEAATVASAPPPPPPAAVAPASTSPPPAAVAPRPAPAPSLPAPPSPALPPSAASAPSPAAPPVTVRAVVPPVAEVAPATVGAPTPVRSAPVEATPVAPAPEPPPLQRDEVREVQTRLRSFGFNPGPIDGAAGPMTHAAVMHYQQNRGQQQAGAVDRQLLEQLRQDPAPQVVATQVAQRTARRGPSRAARSSDPFEPLQAAARRFEQWVQSLGR